MADFIGPEDKEKSIYLKQLQYLDEQLERCQLQCDELKQQNKDLAFRCSTLAEDKTDIAEYLERCVVREEQKVEELLERLQTQQQTQEEEMKALKLQHSQELQELQDRIHELTSGNQTLAGQLGKQQKQQEEEQQEQLVQQLVREREEREAAMDSLRRETQLEIKSLLDEEMFAMNNCVAPKVFSIIYEETAQHRKPQDEFMVLLDETTSLFMKRHSLLKEEGDLYHEISNTQNDIDELTQNICTHKEEAEQLWGKCQELKANLKDCLSAHQEEILRQSLPSESEENGAEVDRLRAELQEESGRRRQLEGVMKKAVIVLRHLQTDPEKPPRTQLKMLLEILKSSAPQGPGSTPAEESQGPAPQTSAQSLNLESNPLFLLVRHRPGDTGFVPRPMWKLKAATSRT